MGDGFSLDRLEQYSFPKALRHYDSSVVVLSDVAAGWCCCSLESRFHQGWTCKNWWLKSHLSGYHRIALNIMTSHRLSMVIRSHDLTIIYQLSAVILGRPPDRPSIVYVLPQSRPAGPCFIRSREIQSSDSYPFATRGHCQSSHR